MEIDINQKKISIGDKYQIFIDGQQRYSASRQLLQLLGRNWSKGFFFIIDTAGELGIHYFLIDLSHFTAILV